MDLVIIGGRVLDPETGLDAVRSVGIKDGTVVAITDSVLEAEETIDASSLVVAPGFIDLHAHGQDAVSNRLQALDGVTTALDMEAGVYPLNEWLASRQDRALINYGATVSHPGARAFLVDGVRTIHLPTLSEEQSARVSGGRYAYELLDDEGIEGLGRLLETEIDAGALGIGFGLQYTPGASRLEILRAFRTARSRGVPAYVHLRSKTIGAFQEAIANAAATGASVHIVHMNSTAGEAARTALDMIRGARERGLDVTAEAYPYTAGSTRIESAYFDSWEGLSDAEYSKLQWGETGERLDSKTFRRYRERGGWVIIHERSEPTNEWVTAQPDVIVASDGIPFLFGRVHPRGAGTFSRVLGHYARDRGVLTLTEALAKMTILPALRVEGAAPSMKRKGRVQVGADADLTIFDPATIDDRATYVDPDLPSDGIVHVLVGGTPVVRDGETVEDVYPGQAIIRLPGLQRE